MSITIDTKPVAKENETIHLMPCKIDYDGEANVKSYFTTSIRQDDKSGVQTASFRGRPLYGEPFQVPEGYTGIIMSEPHKPFSEEDDRKFKITHKFQDFQYWNLDRMPRSNDKIQQAKQWMKIAETLHSPIDPVN